MPSRPSMRALRAFAEVCRAGGVAPAARTLGVSPSAVSHLLRGLEGALGVALFAGRHAGEPLSEAGERLRRGLGGAFEAIDSAVAEMMRHEGEVRVSVPYAFSTFWLVPRLERFRAARPGTHLLLAAETRRVDLASEPYDCAIRRGAGDFPGLEATLLFRERLVVVANPRLLAEAGGDAARLPRIAARTRAGDWPPALAALGLPAEAPATVTLETRVLTVPAALAGLGAAMAERRFVEDLVAAGMLALVAPDWPGVELETGFYFAARAERLRDRHLRGFRDWLVEEARRCGGAPT
jgi:LysR family glycine cleavage system transcriptional activator